MTRAVASPLLDDGAGQGSPPGRPLLPADPWGSSWVPPTDPIVARRHLIARRRQAGRRLPSQDADAMTPVGPVDQLAPHAEPEAAIPHGPAPATGRRPQPGTAPTPTAVAFDPALLEPYPAAPDYRPPTGAKKPAPITDLSPRLEDEERANRRDRLSRRSLSAVLTGSALTATAYWYYALAALIIAIAVPLAAGWHSTTVMSGSMEPLLSAGDVIAFTDYGGDPLGVGTIIQFEDPVHPGATITHRVVDINNDGTYQTKGDANANADSTPVPPDAILGVATFVSPYAGLPQYWWATKQYSWLVAWIVVTAGALSVITIHGRLSNERPSRKRWLRPAIAVGLLAALAGVGTAGRSSAAFTGSTTNQDSRFAASASFDSFSRLGSLGVAACSTTTSTTLMLQAPVPVGSTIIIRYAMRDRRQNAAYGASDTQGNSYTLDARARRGARTETAILSSYITSPLATGDQITVSHPRGRAVVVSFDEFSGITSDGRVFATNTASGKSSTPSVTVDVSDDDTLVIGSVSTRKKSAVYTQPAGWNPLDSGRVACNRRMVYGGGWLESGAPGNVTYDPTLSKTAHWAEAVVAYRRG